MKRLILFLFILAITSCSEYPTPETEKFTAVLDGDTIDVNKCYYKTAGGFGDFLIIQNYKSINYSNGKHHKTIFVSDTDTTRHITGQIISENDSLIIFKKKR